MDDYLSARMITTPFGLYDCDVPCDGSVAIVVSAVDAARDLRHPPVLVDAVGTQITERWSWDQGMLSHEPMVMGPAAHVWSRTSLRPADVDVAELYDGFSFNCLSWIEALGFCGIGEAAAVPRRRHPHRARRRAAAQHPRRPALGRPHPRLRVHPRGRRAAARRRRRPPGARRRGRHRLHRRRHPRRRLPAHPRAEARFCGDPRVISARRSPQKAPRRAAARTISTLEQDAKLVVR